MASRIPQEGKLVLIGFQKGSTRLDDCTWRLFTNNLTITDTTVLADFTEAAWTGYAAVTAGPWSTPVINAAFRAQMNPVTQPAFLNSSGVAVTFYGWYLVDPTGTFVISAGNLGLTTLPDGLTFNLSTLLTDDQQ